jgi:Fe-S oxidoreductase
MCPSFMATREEMHSTRGRAHLLFEMLQGNPLQGGWRSDTVREALDLCLACKGCKGECPVNVDMATYKAEFLAHYYRWRLRPMSALSMGRIDLWARIASWFPGLANSVTQSGLGGLSKKLAGIAPQRAIPTFARRNQGRPPVMIWPDTFNNYFHPEVAAAATEVLEQAGFQVVIPRVVLCCGRPLYDFGLLRPAQRYLRSILAQLQPHFRDGTPIVTLEPSCLSVFREEARNLFPHDRDVFRLGRQSMTLSEFLISHAPEYQPPQLKGRRAIVQPHCHHKSVIGFDSEHALLKRTGLELNVLESGCCGMAGSFGFERNHYDISMKIAERGLLPAVRAAQADDLVIADGFSCATQIEQGSGCRAMHLAQVLAMNQR